jgi:hypothetical protein
MIAAPPAVYPWPIGAGPSYHPAAANPAVLAGRPVGRLRCIGGARFSVHVELFARREVAIVPPGIGVARSGCGYPVRTTTPTGVVEVARTGRYTLGDLFRVWGRRLDDEALLSFRGRVSVFVAGLRRLGDPRSVVLTPHEQIVVEVGGYVTPHPSYLFPKGAP